MGLANGIAGAVSHLYTAPSLTDPIARLLQAISDAHDGAHMLAESGSFSVGSPNLESDGYYVFGSALSNLTDLWPAGVTNAQVNVLQKALHTTIDGYQVYINNDYVSVGGALTAIGHKGAGDSSAPWRQESESLLRDAWAAASPTPQVSAQDAGPQLLQNIHDAIVFLNQALAEAEQFDSGRDAMYPFLDQIAGALGKNISGFQSAVAPPGISPIAPPHVVTVHVPKPSQASSTAVTTVATVGLGGLAVAALVAYAEGKTIDAVIGGAWRAVKKAFA